MARVARHPVRAAGIAGALALLIVASGGCVSLTGRTAGQWVDDQTITAKVKKRLAGVRAETLVDVNVDTYGGVVYLSGVVDSTETKHRLEQAAQAVKNVEQVVMNVTTQRPAGSPVAASPSTELSSRRLEVGAHPLRDRIPGIRRIDADPATLPRGPWAAYDATDRLVATIYTVAMPHLAQNGLQDLRAAGGVVDHVSIYPLAAHGDVPEPQYHIVLWHISRTEAAQLR